MWHWWPDPRLRGLHRYARAPRDLAGREILVEPEQETPAVGLVESEDPLDQPASNGLALDDVRDVGGPLGPRRHPLATPSTSAGSQHAERTVVRDAAQPRAGRQATGAEAQP